jgi:hypothetical protein
VTTATCHITGTLIVKCRRHLHPALCPERFQRQRTESKDGFDHDHPATEN